jgi:hypothetical protein
MTDVNFVHPAGDVLLRGIAARVEDGTVSITGLVSADVWDHIELEDVFGARTRVRHGSLDAGGDVRITVSAPESATGPGAGPFARDWSILDASRLSDGADGEVWIGLSFEAPPQWLGAASGLDELGLTRSDQNDVSVTYVDDDGTRVEVVADVERKLATITCTRSVTEPDATALVETLKVLNAVNDRFVAGTAVVSGSDLVLKVGLPIPDNGDVSAVLEDLAYALPGMTAMVVDAAGPVMAGKKSAADAIEELFG